MVPSDTRSETEHRRSHSGGSLYALLFDADGTDQELDADAIDLHGVPERQLLWMDLQHRDDDAWLHWLQSLGLSIDAYVLRDEGRPRLHNFGDFFLVRAIVASRTDGLQFPGQALTLITGKNVVITLHREPLEYLTQLRERERGDTQLGMLSGESFTASVLDWLLTTYFDAVAGLEAAIDRLELRVLRDRVQGESLPELVQLRRAASHLRRMLAPHRAVFGAMARPDFRPDADGRVAVLFRALNDRFERSLEAVESARVLVIGSFELFATRTAQRTSETMRVLTFVTVLLGSLAVVASVLGMNFHTSLFRTGERGFAITIAAMALVVIGALVAARWRRWL